MSQTTSTDTHTAREVIAELTITHTAAEGTLLEGTVKGDGAWEAIKAAQARYQLRGWKYFPSIRAIGITHSRDRAPQLGLIDRTAQLLRDAGFAVSVEIDGNPRDMAESEADRAQRMAQRADALAGKSAKLQSEADSRFTAAKAIVEGIPSGQPILVGHHSEKGHRRVLRQMDSHMRKGIEASGDAEHAAQRAVTAAHHMETRTNPRRVYRRIRTQEAELRGVERELTGYSRRHLDGNGKPLYVFDHEGATGRRAEELVGRQAHLQESIRYWREALDAAQAAGADVPPDTGDIKKGWWVHSWAGWNKVVRVNKVTVTVRDSWGPGRPEFDRKITLDDIRAIRETNPADPQPHEAVDLAADLAADLDAGLAALDAADAEKAATSGRSGAPTPAPAPQAVAARPVTFTRAGLSEPALQVLLAAVATERSVHLPVGQLDRTVYQEVDRALSRLAGGGRWDRRERAHLYTRDPRPDLEKLTGTRAMPAPLASRDKELSFWRTPPGVAAELAQAVIGLRQSAPVLEPSAGDGALIEAIRHTNRELFLTAIELDPTRAGQLARRHGGERVTVRCQRFQDYAPTREHLFDAVIMNPPFTEPGDRLAWVEHLEVAWSLLGIGGRLAAIVPASLEFGQQRRIAAIRELITTAGGEWHSLPEDAFTTSGTCVRTLLVRATKPA